MPTFPSWDGNKQDVTKISIEVFTQLAWKNSVILGQISPLIPFPLTNHTKDGFFLFEKRAQARSTHTHTHTHTHIFVKEGSRWVAEKSNEKKSLLRTWERVGMRSSGSPAGGDGERAFSWDVFENLLLFLGCPGSALLCGLFPGCGEQGLLWSCSERAACFGGFSCFRVQALGTWASVVAAPGLEHTLSSCGMWA